MNNKEYQLILENWRTYINESPIDEGIKEKIINFAKTKLQPVLQKFMQSIQTGGADLNVAEFKEIAATSPEIADIGKDLAAAKQNFAADIKDSASLEESYSSKNINEILSEIEEAEKQIDEFGIGAAVGAGLGALGGMIFITKWIIKFRKNSGKSVEGLTKALTLFEQIEQKIKNVISKAKVFDAAGYQMLKGMLKVAQKNPNGKLGKYFIKSGIKIYMQPGKELPPFKVISNKNFQATNKDIAQHVQHSYGDDHSHGAVHEQEDMSNLNRASRKQMAASTDTTRLNAEEAAEVKKLVAINQKLVYMCILGGFALYGITTLASHGIHGVAGAVELGATGVKTGEIGQAVVGAATKMV